MAPNTASEAPSPAPHPLPHLPAAILIDLNHAIIAPSFDELLAHMTAHHPEVKVMTPEWEAHRNTWLAARQHLYGLIQSVIRKY